ncbi:MAG: hypothetical protein Q7R80_00290 [bacterium]|nr:hypothetical protein [bacterium]
MDRHAQKVFLAVAIGVGLGILTGRAIGGAFAWMLGAALGGASAYVLFAPIAALRAIPAAYRAARGWHLTSEQWEEVRWTIWAILSPFTSMLAVVFTIAWCDKDQTIVSTSMGWAKIVFPTVVFGTLIGMMGAILTEVKLLKPPTGWSEWCGRMPVRRSVAAHTLLPVLLFWHLPRTLWLVATVFVPGVASFVGHFAWQWFRLVHSDLRMICLADAFLFAGIGTLVGGPILAWMVGGGAFGVLNYHVVSVRWLKLQPIRSAK